MFYVWYSRYAFYQTACPRHKIKGVHHARIRTQITTSHLAGKHATHYAIILRT